MGGTLAAWLVSNKYADINNYVNVDGAKSKRVDYILEHNQ